MVDETPATTPPASDPVERDADDADMNPRDLLRQPISESASADTVALRDELTEVQTSATRAAQLSGEHFTRLLYGPSADAHISPYGVPPVPNSLDSREK
jgi:hypothetical protein